MVALMVGKLRPEGRSSRLESHSRSAVESVPEPAWAARIAVLVCKADFKINRSSCFLGFWARPLAGGTSFSVSLIHS